MKRMTRRIVAKTLWLAKGAALFWGSALTLAVVLGVTTTALAAVPGDPLRLGQLNTIDALTRFTGTANNALLRIDNDSKGANATALELRTDPKKPPMKVSSFARVEKLNADLLDGRSAEQFANGVGGTAVDADNLDGRDSTSFADGTGGKANDADKLDGKDSTAFVSKIYIVESRYLGQGGGNSAVRQAFCDLGDKVLGGGGGSNPHTVSQDNDVVIKSEAQIEGPNDESWFVKVRDNGVPDYIGAQAVCADFPPLR